MIKKVSATIAVGLVTAAGYTAIPQRMVYENVPLYQYHNQKQDLIEKTWNGEARATIGDIQVDESWLLPDKLVDIIPKKKNSVFVEGWMNYLGPNGWERINTIPVSTSGGFEVKKAPFEAFMPSRSTGIATFLNNNRWNIKTKQEDLRTPLQMSVKALGVADVAGEIETGDIVTPTGLHKNQSWVVYRNAYPNADLIYYVHHGVDVRLLYLVRFNSAPAQTDYQFEISFSHPVQFKRKINGQFVKWLEKSNLNVPLGSPVALESQTKPVSFEPARIWDSNVTRIRGQLATKVQTIPMTISTSTGSYIITKFIPLSFFSGATLPVYIDPTATFNPDADVESGSVDGQALGESLNGSWNTVRTAAGVSSTDSTANPATPYINAAPSSLFDQISRTFFSFETDSIADTDTIDECDLQINVNGKDTTIAVGYIAVATKIANLNSIVAADYQANVAPTSISNGTTTGANISTTGYNKWTCNSYGLTRISLTATTTVGLQFAEDVTNTDPGSPGNVETYILVQMAETAGMGSDPLLTVTSTAAVVAVPQLQDDGGFFLLLTKIKEFFLGEVLAKL